MPFKSRVISVSTTPTIIASSTIAVNSTAAISLAGAHIQDPTPLLLWNPSTQNVYLGGTSMTTASSLIGIPFPGPGHVPFNLLTSDPLAACTTDATVTLTVLGGRQ